MLHVFLLTNKKNKNETNKKRGRAILSFSKRYGSSTIIEAGRVKKLSFLDLAKWSCRAP